MKKTKFIRLIVGLMLTVFVLCMTVIPTFVKAAPTYKCNGGDLECVTVEVLGGTLTFYKSPPDPIT